MEDNKIMETEFTEEEITKEEVLEEARNEKKPPKKVKAKKEEEPEKIPFWKKALNKGKDIANRVWEHKWDIAIGVGGICLGWKGKELYDEHFASGDDDHEYQKYHHQIPAETDYTMNVTTETADKID